MSTAEHPRVAFLTLSLTWVGGFVDGVAFLTLHGMFVTFMSGNTTIAGVGMAQRTFDSGWLSPLPIAAFPIAAFVLGGVLAGVFLFGVQRKRSTFRSTAVVFIVEALLLGLFIAFGQCHIIHGNLMPENIGTFFALAALPALAMGMQNVSLRQSIGMRDGMTFVSGTLTGIAESLSRGLVDVCKTPDSVAEGPSMADKGFRRAGWLALVWFSFLFGVLAGAVTTPIFELFNLTVPIVVLLLCAAVLSRR